MFLLKDKTKMFQEIHLKGVNGPEPDFFVIFLNMAVFLLSKLTSFKSYLKTLTIPQGLLAVPQTVVLDNTLFCIILGLVYVMCVLASRRLRTI